jgi:hypothetical protein
LPNVSPIHRWTAVLAVVVVWGVLRTWFYIGYYMEDAPGFAADAALWAAGEWQPRENLPGLRIGTYLPAGVAIWLVGKTEFALSAWSLLSSLVGLLSLVGISRLLLVRGWWLLGALLWIAYPGDIIFSTVLMPDAIQTGWLVAAVYLMMHASANPGRRALVLFASGMTLGVCYLVRENAILLLPVLLVGVGALPWTPPDSAARRRWAAGTVLAGFLAVIVVEGAFYGYQLGAPLHRFAVSQSYYGGQDAIMRHGLTAYAWTIPEAMLPPVSWLRGSAGTFSLNPGQAYHAYLFVLAMALWLVACARWMPTPPDDRRRLIFLSCWFWLPVLYHQFGSQSLTSFVPMHRLPRQLMLYGPAAAVMIAWGASRTALAMAGLARPIRMAAAALLVAGLSMHAAGVNEGLRIQLGIVSETTSIQDRVVSTLAGYSGRVFMDSADAGALHYFLNPLGGGRRVDVHDLMATPSCEALAGALVVLHSNRTWSFDPPPTLLAKALERLPCLRAPPPEWRPISVAPWLPERIYLVPERSSPAAGSSFR